MGGNFHLLRTKGIRSCLLGPWLLLKLLPPQPPQERRVAISHVGVAPSLPANKISPKLSVQANERYLLSNPESPPRTVYKSIQGIKGARELLLRLSLLFQELYVTLGKRSSLPKSHLRSHRTPHWIVCFSSAQPDPSQFRVARSYLRT